MATTQLNWQSLWVTACCWFVSFCAAHSAAYSQIRLPAIDPSGERIFLPPPNYTTIMTPFSTSGGVLGRHAPADSWHPWRRLHEPVHQPPVTPAFQQPPAPPHCTDPNCQQCLGSKSQGHVRQHPTRGKAGEIILTPARIIAPVGSEVVVLAGICGEDGYFMLNQPLEWMVSNDSVGQIIEVGGMEHPNFNRAVPPSSKKFDGQYAWGRTGLKEKLLTRGTPTPADDIHVLKGQTYLSLSSASTGTTYLTCVAPQCSAWDKRRATTIIHWVDGLWSIPLPVVATNGSTQTLTTLVTRVADGTGIAGWKVRYSIIGGAPAEFFPTGSQTAEVETNTEGQALVQVRQQAGQALPGTTQIRVDVIRPAMLGEAELVVESGCTSITWSAPALTIRALGPRTADLNQPFNYRLEITNPGDQIARDVVVRSDDFAGNVQYISSNPKPAEFGSRLEWRLGDIPPGSGPRVIDINLKSDQRGMRRVCFEVASAADRLTTTACAETEISTCLEVRISGPDRARVGDQVTFQIELINHCDNELQEVMLQAALEPGLTALGLGNPIQAPIGTLRFGQKMTLPLTLQVIDGGVQCFNISVVAQGGHTAAARHCLEATALVQGQATIGLTGQQILRVGQTTIIRATLTNTGNVPLTNITVTNRFSPSLAPTQATQRFPHHWLGNDLAFTIARLEPGQQEVIEVEYQAERADREAFTQFSLTTPSGAQAVQRLGLQIDNGAGPPAGDGGIRVPADPAGGLQVQAEVLTPTVTRGQPARIRLLVRNNRNFADNRVDISFLVPPGLELTEFDNSQGHLPIVERSPDNTQFRLQRRESLLAGETLEFILTVVGRQPGQMSVEFQVTSDNTLGAATQRATLSVTP